MWSLITTVGISTVAAADGWLTPRGKSLARAIARESGGLIYDRSLSVAARTHLAALRQNPTRAKLSEVQAILTRQGDALTRLKPVAIVGASPVERRSQLLELARGAGRAQGFTHFGLAVDDRGPVVLIARRVLPLTPLIEVSGAEAMLLRGRAQPHERVQAWLLEPSSAWPRPRRTPLERQADGRFQVRFVLSRPGPWTLQVIVDAGYGPEVALLRHVRKPTKGRPIRSLSSSGFSQLAKILTPARQSPDAPEVVVERLRSAYELGPVVRHIPLERAAEAHAEAVCRARWAVHRLPGLPGPGERVRAVRFEGRVVEAVAISSAPSRALRNLLESPAHLAGLLDPTVELVGIGSARSGSAYCLVIVLRSP